MLLNICSFDQYLGCYRMRTSMSKGNDHKITQDQKTKDK